MNNKEKIQSINNCIMVTYEFDKPLYIAPLNDLVNIAITEHKEQAELWHSEFDRTKLAYHRKVTGYNLVFESI
jgi:hypothetical protein